MEFPERLSSRVEFPERLNVEQHCQVDSTQELVRERIKAGDDVHGLVVRAEEQTGGRGRFERRWYSGPGGSYQTLALHDPPGELRSGRVPLAIAVGIAEILAESGVELRLKWPNDIYLADASTVDETSGSGNERLPHESPLLPGKVGGILCEHHRGHLLIGVGLNVRNEVPTGAGALRSLKPERVSELVLDGVRRGVTEIVVGPGLAERFAPFDLLRGREIEVAHDRGRWSGRAAGISEQGCLRLLSETKELEMCSGRIVKIDAAAGV